jgi:aminoglycoside phosphotransferase (APT) family kinase protein
MPITDKDMPSPDWIRSLRGRYPTERRIDHLLTRKMNLRSGPGYRPLSLDALVDGVRSLLSASLERPGFTVGEARWLSGGASKLQMAFTLDWDRPGVGRERTPRVLRMEPAESIVATDRLREFQLIKAFDGEIPVPPVFWCDPDGRWLPYPALIYGFAEGSTKPKESGSGVSGTGIRLSSELRVALGQQFVDHLATIHRHPIRDPVLTAFDIPEPGTQSALWSVNWWDRVWEEDGGEEIPLLRLASGWLRRNLPFLETPTIVHADYRIGNFLFTENDSRITAILDWELGQIGDRHQDLAWTTSRTFSGVAEDGSFLVCGMLPERQFFEMYEEASGYRVDPKRIAWYKIYNNFWLAILLIGTGYRVARNAKTHQDVLVTWLMGIGAIVLDQMRGQIEEAA